MSEFELLLHRSLWKIPEPSKPATEGFFLYGSEEKEGWLKEKKVGGTKLASAMYDYLYK